MLRPKKPSAGTQIPSALNEAKWELAKEFKDSYKQYLASNPEIRSAMADFNRCKRLIPPTQLPGKMKEHKLDGPLKGLYDCHLSADVILIYEPLDDGVYRLLKVCEHADLKGPKAKNLARLKLK
jgi:addiction module RelE/StbE family toxin